MDDFSPVMTRCSCREYTDSTVPEYLLRTLVHGGMRAPSARNERPWEFLILCSEESRRQVTLASPYASMCEKASAVILVLANMERISPESPWWVQDLSACTENILIRATELGLGAVWLGIYPRQARMEALQKAFALPENLLPFAAVPIGYPARERENHNRYEAERVRWIRQEKEK